MVWEKLGLIFDPKRDASWIASHACPAVPVVRDNGVCRVFFSGRDPDNRSHMGWFDVDLKDPLGGIKTNDRYLAAPGPLGYFDDHGIFPSSAVRLRDRLRIYTIGWTPGIRKPLFYASVGMIETSDFGETYDARSVVPVLGRSIHDPCHVTGPFVMLENEVWRMWYVSGMRWVETADGLQSHYNIKYAESHDGIDWRRDGLVSVDFADPKETNIARPCIVRGDIGYEAWFAYDRGSGYRIGYGRSRDGYVFERDSTQPATIEPSSRSFETDAVCHPAIVSYAGRRFMFYNGNGFGRDGVALAVQSSQSGNAA
jgi:hypothetical protein